MNSAFISSNEIRLRFTHAMSEMYQNEVPLYKKLLVLANDVNKKVINNGLQLKESDIHNLTLEHHGAIRVGTEEELFTIRRLFSVMGMYPVDYYDLSVANIPVHSTAFRALNKDDLAVSPFRVFCSLLRLDLIENDELRTQAKNILSKRSIFPKQLLKLIESSEKHGGLDQNQANLFIEHALEVFRWHEKATVDKQTYDQLKSMHGLIADIVSFKGPHINHLTPKILDIDECQQQFDKQNIKAKAVVEGPPKRKCPILLRQTSFVAIEESIIFSDGEKGLHTARFGEVEQRGMALTPKGRALYDELLNKARNADKDKDYSARLNEAFKAFPDNYKEIHQQNLAYFNYSINTEQQNLLGENDYIDALVTKEIIKITPINYEDFLPVSAAGIFTSNLAKQTNNEAEIDPIQTKNKNDKLEDFEKALGITVQSSFKLYEHQQQESLNDSLKKLGVKPSL